MDNEISPKPDNRHWSQDETIARWIAECNEEKRLQEAYRAVYDDMQNASFARACVGMPEDARDAVLLVIEQALRLAYCCTLCGERAPAIVSSHERKLYAAISDASGTHHMLIRKRGPMSTDEKKLHGFEREISALRDEIYRKAQSFEREVDAIDERFADLTNRILIERGALHGFAPGAEVLSRVDFENFKKGDRLRIAEISGGREGMLYLYVNWKIKDGSWSRRSAVLKQTDVEPLPDDEDNAPSISEQASR